MGWCRRPLHFTGEATPGSTLNPAAIGKYLTPLLVPPAMPRARKIPQRRGKNIDYYEIAVRQFSQQILPPGLPPTTVWGYGPAVAQNGPAIFNAPSLTIEAKRNTPVRVRWINDLVDPAGNFLPHLLPVDPTLHWANPPGGNSGRDMRPTFETTPDRYMGPVPFVTHVHGSATKATATLRPGTFRRPRTFRRATPQKGPGISSSAPRPQRRVSLLAHHRGSRGPQSASTSTRSARRRCGITIMCWG